VGRVDTGTIISGIGHAGVILWVLFGGILFSPKDAPEMAATDVSLLSEAEFDALVEAAAKTPEPAEQPALPEVTPPAPVQPELDAVEPQPAPTEDTAPAQEAPAPQEEPVQEAAPDTTELAAIPAPDVAEAPDQTTPQVAPEDPLALPSPTPPTPPRPAPRVAPLAVEAPDPEVAIAEEDVAAVAPDATPDAPVVAEEQPATAQEEAGTVLETEATETPPETPVLAPSSSARPKSRPTRTAAAEPAPDVSEPVAEAAAEEPAVDPEAAAIAAAVAEANAADNGVEEGGNTAPQGPPMTSGEKDGLRVAIQKCWNVGALSSEAMRMTVSVSVSMSRDGRPDVASIQMVDFSGGSEAAAKQAYEAARRAIVRCGNDGFQLPEEKYEEWKELRLNFDSSGMVLR
jgi:hypothetical protein